MKKDWDKYLFSKEIIEYMSIMPKDEVHYFSIIDGHNSTSLIFKTASELEFLLESTMQSYQNGFITYGTELEIRKLDGFVKVATFGENWKGEICWFFYNAKRLNKE